MRLLSEYCRPVRIRRGLRVLFASSLRLLTLPLAALFVGCQSATPASTRSTTLSDASPPSSSNRSDELPAGSPRPSSSTGAERTSGAPVPNPVSTARATPYTVVDYHLDERRSHLVVYVYFSTPVGPQTVSDVMKREMESLVANRSPRYDVQMFSWLRTPATPPGEAERLRMADGNSYYFYDVKQKAITAGGKL